jgi:predicted alpha/beta hydrolase family esterase
MTPKIIIIHGNGGADEREGWLPGVAAQLETAGFDVINKTFPDNQAARANIWLPHITQLGADEHTIIIGHSSGAVAALRYAETHHLLGSVLVSPCYTDLGDDLERRSGYYDTPWDWPAIKANQRWIIQFASPTDPYIPIKEARYIQKQLGTTYHELPARGHFMDNTFPELVPTLLKKIGSNA